MRKHVGFISKNDEIVEGILESSIDFDELDLVMEDFGIKKIFVEISKNENSDIELSSVEIITK